MKRLAASTLTALEHHPKNPISFKPAGSWRPSASKPGTREASLAAPVAPPVAPQAGSPESRFVVEGMTCGNCARHVREAASAQEGVYAAEASAESGSLTVWWKPGVRVNLEAVAKAVTGAGYPARAVAEGATAGAQPGKVDGAVSGWSRSLVWSMACALPLMAGEWVLGWHHAPWFNGLGFVLATIAMWASGSRFALGAWRQLRVGEWGMDALVTLGAGTAYFYSIAAWAMGMPGHLYFMEAASILAFISAGHWLEARVGSKAETALKSLMRLAPTRTRRIRGGVEQEVEVSALEVGDTVLLRPGDRVPTDGSLKQGEGGCDESMLTGESLPKFKRPGDVLYGGTVNLEGQWTMEVRAVGAATALAQIVAVVRRAQTSRAKIQRLADKITRVFVPVVVGVAVLSGALWVMAPSAMQSIHSHLESWLWNMPLAPSSWANALMSAAAVLIVACPCAMGLATPAAIMAAANAAARRGILIRDGQALEKAGEITLVAFDKTGTLTLGRPEVLGFFRDETGGIRNQTSKQPWSEVSLNQWKEWAADLARGSRHPISRSIAAMSDVRADWKDWREVRGGGVEGRLSDRGWLIRVGSPVWLVSMGVQIPSEAMHRVSGDLTSSWVGVAVEHEWVGWFQLRDQAKPGAAEMVELLRKTGKKVRLLTGDRTEVAQHMGGILGFSSEEVISEVRPEGKAALVEKMQRGGDRVAFVGDGINDAPALSQADLGIAVTEASDVARETADLLLLRADIQVVPEALELSRRTLRVIRQNLFWAFAYNVAAIPLAATGLMHPVLCAVAMGCSDLIVLGNALRLLRFKMGVRRD